VQVVDEAGDTKTHEQKVGQGEGVDGVSELLDLEVAWSSRLGGSPIPEKNRQSPATASTSLFPSLAPLSADMPSVGTSEKAENCFSSSVSQSVVPPTNYASINREPS
jgi:hypothetical protein